MYSTMIVRPIRELFLVSKISMFTVIPVSSYESLVHIVNFPVNLIPKADLIAMKLVVGQCLNVLELTRVRRGRVLYLADSVGVGVAVPGTKLR